MLKVIVVLFLTITLSLGSFAIFFVPKKFHHNIHQFLIPELSKNSVKTYRKINRSVHETKVQTEKYLSTVTSVSGLTPMDYHVVIKIQNVATQREVEARIYGELSDKIELHMELKDYNNEDPDDGLAFKKARIVFEAPTKTLFVDKAKRAHFLLNNTKMKITVKEVAGIWSVDGGLKESSSGRIDELSWDFNTESAAADDRLKVISKMKVKTVEFSFPKNKGRYENLEQNLNFDSFSKTGLKDNYASLNDVIGKKDESSAPYKFLTMIPLVKDMLSFPFEITQVSTVAHPAGSGSLDFNILIKDIEVYGLNDALQMNLKASCPKEMAESFIVSILAEEYGKAYKDHFYPSDINTPDTVKDYAEMSKLRALAGVKMKAAFENFLMQEVDGKKRVDRVLNVAIAEKLMTYKNGSYSLQASYEKKMLKLGGRVDQMGKLKAAIPASEVGGYLLANGFIQVRKAESR